MKPLTYVFAAVLLATPMLVSTADATPQTASQYSAAGHGRRPIMSNRPSRAIYHRHRYWHHRWNRYHYNHRHPYYYRHHYRY